MYAWMLVPAFDLDASIPRITARDPKAGRAAINHEDYVHLSPWNSEICKRITETYKDLAKHASFRGILSHDDTFLTDFKDASSEALAAYHAARLPGSVEQIHNNS